MKNTFVNRREFLVSSAALGAGILISNSAFAKEEEEVGPAEDHDIYDLSKFTPHDVLFSDQ